MLYLIFNIIATKKYRLDTSLFAMCVLKPILPKISGHRLLYGWPFFPHAIPT